jgi:hypothetical protein
MYISVNFVDLWSEEYTPEPSLSIHILWLHQSRMQDERQGNKTGQEGNNTGQAGKLDRT